MAAARGVTNSMASTYHLTDAGYATWIGRAATGTLPWSTSAVAVGKFLEDEGCGSRYFQLESGEGMTLPPGR